MGGGDFFDQEYKRVNNNITTNNPTNNRVPSQQGKQGKVILFFPDRENSENLLTM